MNASLKTISAAIAAIALASLVSTTSAGSVTLYEHAYYSGQQQRVDGVQLKHIYNLGCFNDRASSAQWSDLPEWGSFDDHAVIAFYTDKDCGGYRKLWYTSDNHPNNFEHDRINDQVSSFQVLEFNGSPDQYVAICPWKMETGELAGNVTSVDATDGVTVTMAETTAANNATIFHV